MCSDVCRCSGAATAEACFTLASGVRFFGFTQSFPYYQAAGITNPEVLTHKLSGFNCEASGCVLRVSPFHESWYQTLNAAALCYNVPSFLPADAQ